MTPRERLLVALYVSEAWWVMWVLNPRRLHWKAHALVVFDRVLCNDKRIEETP